MRDRTDRLHTRGLHVTSVLSLLALVITIVMLMPDTQAYQRYNDGCQSCHGAFTDGTSTKGSVFPGGNKHYMHRDSDVSAMNTDCNMCHTSGDQKNPYLGSSNNDGNGDAPGLGCSGCHNGNGLRLHHEANGNSSCINCHGPGSAPNESIAPAYYGTIGTRANGPCNSVEQVRVNENWTLNDFIGLDNDGDNDYDAADSDCSGPAGAGRIGSGSLTVALDSNGDVVLNWAPSCNTGDSDYGVYEGDLQPFSPSRSFTSHRTVACGTSGATSLTFTPADTMQYYLIVPNNGSAEGSYGMSNPTPGAGSGTMVERSQGVNSCDAQIVGACS